jgi:hypothetical protein
MYTITITVVKPPSVVWWSQHSSEADLNIITAYAASSPGYISYSSSAIDDNTNRVVLVFDTESNYDGYFRGVQLLPQNLDRKAYNAAQGIIASVSYSS